MADAEGRGPFTRRQQFCGSSGGLHLPRGGCVVPRGAEAEPLQPNPRSSVVLVQRKPRCSREAIREALQKGWERLPSSSAYYFHLHHSLPPTEDLWGTKGCEISVHLWNSMEEHFDLARTQPCWLWLWTRTASSYLNVVCVFGRAGRKQQQCVKMWPMIVRF